MRYNTRMSSRINIALIGMPGAGKSTVGVLLAKEAGMSFIDTDLLIQQGEGLLLQDIIDRDGVDAFCDLEAEYVGRLACASTVIATGGSVIYRAGTLEHLGRLGPRVFLDISLDSLAPRIANLATRGTVRMPGQSFADLYATRRPLYQSFSDITIDCDGMTPADVCMAILAALT